MRSYNMQIFWILFITLLLSLPGMTWAGDDPVSSNVLNEGKVNWEVYTNRTHIQSLLLSDDRTVFWVGTSAGLEKRNATSGDLIEEFINLTGLPDNDVRTLISDDQGGIWVGTANGLAHLNTDGTFDVFYEDNSGLPNNSIHSLLTDGQGGIWIGTEGYLTHLNSEGIWEYDFLNLDKIKKNITLFCHDSYGVLLGYENQSLLSVADFYSRIGEFHLFRKEMEASGWDCSIYYELKDMICEDNSNDELVLIMDMIDSTNESFNENLDKLIHTHLCHSYNSSWAVTSLTPDDQGGIWLGMDCDYEGAVCHLKSNGILDYISFTSRPPSFLLSDGQGGVWVGMNCGLRHLTSNCTWKAYNYLENETQLHITDDLTYYFSKPIIQINSLFFDEQMDLWAATDRGLFIFISDEKWEAFDQNRSISAITSNGQGGFWMSTNEGSLIHKSFNGSLEMYEDNVKRIPSNNVTSLLSDTHNGGVWVGTDNGLGYLNSDGTWGNVLHQQIEITALESDTQGRGIWVGHSLERWQYNLSFLNHDGTWEREEYTRLYDRGIRALETDNKRGVWVSTYGKELDLAYPPRVHDELFYRKADGSYESIFKAPDIYKGYTPVKQRIHALLSDEQTGVWVGTNFGLRHLKVEGESTQDLYNKNGSSFSPEYVNSLYSDKKGGLWVGTYENLGHLKTDGTWDIFNISNIYDLFSEDQENIWVGTASGLAHLKSSGIWDVLDERTSGLPENIVTALHPDGHGGIWVGTRGSGLAHLILLGSAEQILETDSSYIMINWFLKSSPLIFKNVQYIELQRSLSKVGAYETVFDLTNNPVRFYVDYTECQKNSKEKCFPKVEGHTLIIKEYDDNKIMGYELNTPITDAEWLEGLPRYYLLSAVIRKNGELMRMTENSEAVMMTPTVEEKPRVGLALDRSAIAVSPGTEKELSLFLSSLDLFSGEVTLAMESDNPYGIDIKLDSESISLNPGETKSLNFQIQVHSDVLDSETSIRVIAKAANQDVDKSTLLKVQAGASPMVALNIAESRTRPRVMEGITVSGNIIPAQAAQEVVISGNDIDSLVLTTDENGNFEGALTPRKAGWLSLTAESNGATSNTGEIFILPTKTHVALSSDVNQETTQGDTLRIQGGITPVRGYETTSHLDIRYLDPADSEAGLKPQFVGDVAIDENGFFYKDIVIPGDGFIYVDASLSETSDFLGVNTKLVIPIGQPVGEGIILVSESGTPEFQEISKSLGTYVYNALKSRNIPQERIRYLGPSDEAIQSDGYADKNNLRHALTDWAVSLISKDDPYKTPLNFYLIGEVKDGTFRLNNNEFLIAEELAYYLDEAEELVLSNSDSDTKGFPATIVLEGSQSEEWIEKIAGNGRIILTSSSARPVDEGGHAGYDNFGETSFSRYFYQFINYGSDIESSFAEANYEILKFYRHTQRPVMDADGDGLGTTKYDRYAASGKFIEYRPSGNLRPEIKTTNPDHTVRLRSTKNSLWAIATDPETEMQGVFCSITDPHENTINIELIQNRGDMYTVEFNDYNRIGCYELVYYAKDKAGNVSLPIQKFVNVISSRVNMGEIPQRQVLTLSVEDTKVSISWSTVENADGYKLFYAPYPDAQYIADYDMGKQTSLIFEGSGTAFYVAVQAYNTGGISDFSNIEFFDLQ